MNKNVWLLFASNAFAFSVAPVTVFLSGIIGSSISPIKSLSTLPMSLSIVGTALFIIAASKIMSITGRKKGFILSSITSSLFALLAAYAVMKQNFILYSFSCFSLGFGMAFAHQYRFAAAESVDKKQAPKAISLLLFAGILSALLGPNLANLGKNIISEGLYVGSYLCLSLLTLSSIIFLVFYNEKKVTEKKKISRGKEFGTVTSRKRRCGWFDGVLVRQTLKISGIDGIALTKLDVLDELDEIKMCIAYEINGKKYDYLPASVDDQFMAKPIYKSFKGWKSSTVGIKNFDRLPDNAKYYIKELEKFIETTISSISTSPERNDTILIKDPFKI